MPKLDELIKRIAETVPHDGFEIVRVPDIIAVPEEWSPKNINQFQVWWNQVHAPHLARPVAFVPHGFNLASAEQPDVTRCGCWHVFRDHDEAGCLMAGCDCRLGVRA